MPRAKDSIARYLFVLTIGIIVMVVCAGAMAAPETSQQKDARMKWWHDARFGMFIHWGVYSVPAGRWNGKEVQTIGEWIMNAAKIPVKDYQALTAQFNPTNYNADAWVRLAKDAGMKYIIITSKHHDGFAMFRSKTSSFNIYDATPFKRDPLKELATACKKHGIKLGFYYSQSQDWNHPGGAALGGLWDKAQEGDYDKFIRTVDVPQVRELLTNYGDVAVLWWDTPVNMTEERQNVLLEPLKLQPNIITNDRLGGRGDFRTPEQSIPVNDTDGDWETCMTINNTWGYKVDDNNWKSTAQLIRHLSEIAARGGNFLLNVGPTSLGEIPQPSVERLEEIGRWMKMNGDSIYGTSRSPFRRLDFDGAVTVRGNKLFAHVWEWPTDGIKLTGLSNSVKAVRFLDGGKVADYAASVTQGGKTTVSIKPPAKPDPADTVVEVTLDGPPQVKYEALKAEVDGSIRLRAADARFTRVLQYNHKTDTTDRWLGTPDSAYWDVDVPQAGEYRVEITYAWYESDIGSEYSVGLRDVDLPSRAQGTVVDTGSWSGVKTFPIGTIKLKAGPQVLDIQAHKVPKGGVMNLREIRLIPGAG
ncbi:MAG: alpha-L-fucosidase [Armatimonadota bacterium]